MPLQQRHEYELELAVLEEIYNRQRVRQRDLADAIGASLGMTNAIIKRLSRKGLLTMRKVNNRNVAYAVTPAGIDAIARKSYRYLKRTMKSVVGYKDALEALVLEVKHRGYRSIVVLGRSDLAFVLEHLCAKYGLEYRQRKVQPSDAPHATGPVSGRSAAADTAGDAAPPDGVAPFDGAGRQFYLYAEHVQPHQLPLSAAPPGGPEAPDRSGAKQRTAYTAGRDTGRDYLMRILVSSGG